MNRKLYIQSLLYLQETIYYNIKEFTILRIQYKYRPDWRDLDEQIRKYNLEKTFETVSFKNSLLL